MSAPLPLILASASPRRLSLLEQIGIQPADVVPADIDETVQPGELPKTYVKRIAIAKGLAIAASDISPQAAILSADTTVAVGRRILPKAEDADTARACLALLSGRRHKVLGGIALVLPGQAVRYRLSETVVRFKRLHPDEIEAYIAAGEWQGKAGGYAIQGMAAAYIDFIQGSYSNVVGLSLYETAQMLKAAGHGA